jgi:hypothetical protein
LLPYPSKTQLVDADGTTSFQSIAASIDFVSYSPQPGTYDERTYFDAEEVLTNAEEVLTNADNNGILEDTQKGFVGLALDIFAELDATGSDDATTTTVVATTTAAAEKVPPTLLPRECFQVSSKSDHSPS